MPPVRPPLREHRLAVILLCGCLISLLTFGLRSTFGLFVGPVSATHGWSREAALVHLPIAERPAPRFAPLAAG